MENTWELPFQTRSMVWKVIWWLNVQNISTKTTIFSRSSPSATLPPKSKLIPSITPILLDPVCGICFVKKQSWLKKHGMSPWDLCWTFLENRYLIEPLSGTSHVKSILVKRFLTFLEQIRKSKKCASKHLLNSIIFDTRSTTGSNLRNILLNTGKSQIQEIVPNDAFEVKYHPIKSQDKWKLPFINDIIEHKNDQESWFEKL